MTVRARIDVDDGAFLASLPAAMEEWRLESYAYLDHVADKVVVRAKELVAKRSGKLASTIHRDPLVVTGKGAYVRVSAGDGTRYAIYVELGTYKDRAQPFMRPALALAAGLLKGAGYAARTATTAKTRAAVKRSVHRAKVRRAQASGLLTSAQARAESKRVSSIAKFRG